MSTTAPYVYQDAPLVTDATALKTTMVNYLTAYMPARFNIPSGSWLDLLLEAWAIQAAQTNDVAQQKLTSDFRYFGTLVGIPPIDATPGQATVTVTVSSSTAAQVVSAGDVFGIVDANSDMQGFTLLADIDIAAGQTTGTGTVVAETAGSVTTNLSGTANVIQAESYVLGAVLGTVNGGVDAESDPDFLNRFTETLGVLTPIPVNGTNFAVLARSIAGIYRATGVNQLKPGAPYSSTAEQSGVDKNVTVAVTDINGQPVGSTILSTAQAYLNSLREDNFQVWVVNAQYDTIDVTQCTVYVRPSWDADEVQAAVVAALDAALSSATAQTDASGNAARWASDPVVHASDLTAAVINASQGIRNVDPIQFGIHGGTIGTADVQLGAGSAIPALPQPGMITVNVVTLSA